MFYKVVGNGGYLGQTSKKKKIKKKLAYKKQFFSFLSIGNWRMLSSKLKLGQNSNLVLVLFLGCF